MASKVRYYKKQNNNPKMEDIFYVIISGIGMCVEYQNTTGLSRVIPKGTELTNLVKIKEKEASSLYEYFLKIRK